MNRANRRQALRAAGLAAGAGLFGVYGATPSHVSGQQKSEPKNWTYVRLDPTEVAAEAYRRMAGNGCMYGVFAGIVGVLARLVGEPFRSFPLHMMRYGEGGCSGWGSLCGALNGGAAMIGLVEPNREQREKLTTELFSWYEAASLPAFKPKNAADAEEMPKCASGSVLCHVSVGKWCKAAGCEVFSKEMGERCRRLTADVAGKTVELLNRNLRKAATFATVAPETQACISCHGKTELRDSLGKIGCASCHKFPGKHPAETCGD